MLPARSVHLLGEGAEGPLHGMCGAGQLLKGFRANSCASCTGGNMALQGCDSCLQRPQLSLALRLESLHAANGARFNLPCMSW